MSENNPVMSHLVLVDDLRQRLGPLSDFHSSFQIPIGGRSNHGRVQLAFNAPIVAVYGDSAVGPHDWPLSGIAAAEQCLLINGAWPATSHVDDVRNLPLHHALLDASGRIVAANAPAAEAPSFIEFMRGGPPDRLSGQWTFSKTDATLISRPWHVVESLADMKHLLPWNNSNTIEAYLQMCPHRQHISFFGGYTINVSPGARIAPFTVFDASKGPIFIHDATIGPFSVVTGPASIDSLATVAPHSQIRANSDLRMGCSVGGEVSYSIVGEYAHKSHAGYLGHSIICSWANLGADTNVSNLKNTYGNVRMQVSAATPPEDTGMVKMGSIIGHFTKTAIGTRLPTGACISTAVMLACDGFAPKFVPPFRFIHGASDEPYRVEDFLETVRKVMKRKGSEGTPAIEARLRAIAARHATRGASSRG